MNITKAPARDDYLPTLSSALPDQVGVSTSAVSWGAIFAGAAAAAALSLILLILGTGLGLSSVSPWAQAGVTAATFGLSTILWITLTQLAASGLGGYLAGRLRTRWVDVPVDEVYFRDTAHGLLTWAVATLATAALLSSVIGSIVTGGVRAGATVAAGTTATAAGAIAAATASDTPNAVNDGSIGYFVDSLFRKDAHQDSRTPAEPAAPNESTLPTADAPVVVSASPTAAPPTGEVARIFASSTGADALPPEDVRYLGQLIVQRTGLSQQEAEQRVVDTYARMQAKARDAIAATKAAADEVRKASSYAALWLFVSLLGGAFVASLAATFGGRQRDL